MLLLLSRHLLSIMPGYGFGELRAEPIEQQFGICQLAIEESQSLDGHSDMRGRSLHRSLGHAECRFLQLAIAACTRAIASGQSTTQSVATLYTSRGIAYGPKASTTGPSWISKRRSGSIHNLPSVIGPILLLLQMADSSFVVVLSLLTAGRKRESGINAKMPSTALKRAQGTLGVR